MSSDENRDLSIDLSGSVDGKTMTAAATAKLSLPQTFIKYFFPRKFANAENLQALTDNIQRKLAAGVPLSDFSPAEHQLLAGALGHYAAKTKNISSIVERATKQAPELKALFEAPQSEPQPPMLPPASQEELKESEPLSDTQVHWWERFRVDAEVVSVEYIQELYAKLLVGQARNPRAFSLKTLEVVRSLDEDTAQLFHKFRGFIVPAFGLPMFMDQRWREYGLRYGDLMDLADAGLVDRSPCFWTIEPESPEIVPYQKWYFKISPSSSAIPREIHGLRITRVGAELLKVLEPDYSKLDVVCSWLSGPRPNDFEISENGEEGPFKPWIDPERKSDT